jgi:hypothetical protein
MKSQGGMMNEPALRVEESLRRLTSLRDEISEWSNVRQRRDPRRQFATQLTSLEQTLVPALERLSALAKGFAPASAAEAYETCREFDGRLLAVRRLWRWFADKFDQRDTPRWARTLTAADEVTWSVYAGVMRATHGGRVTAPAPLPYLDVLDAPEATPRDEPPPDLRPGGYDEALALLMARLPIPVVGLPVSTREAPWELALLGHEVGHHLQYDLLPERQLVASVGQVVAAAAGGGEPGDEWRWWSREIFADLVGLVTLGPASLSALLPLELGTRKHMLDRGRDRYPAPAVRIALMAQMAADLGLTLDEELPEADDPAGLPAGIRADLARVPAVASALVGYRVADRGTLARLSDFSAVNFRPGGKVATRATQLAGNLGVTERGISVTRSLTSAGMVAWRRVSSVPDRDKRSDGLAALGSVLVDWIVASAEEGTRSAQKAAKVTEASFGAELADILGRGLVR